MRGVFTTILDSLPRRRRRSWRYVSGRRRRVGMLLLLAMALGIYGAWHFTNEDRLRQQAETYLREFTGADVRIGTVELSPLEGIRLADVRIAAADAGRTEELFTAREVRLRHNPLSLLTRGRLRVTEIVCTDPVLTIRRDLATGQRNTDRFLSRRGGYGGARGRERRRMPSVQFRNAQVRFVDVVAGSPFEYETWRVQVTGGYGDDPQFYQIDVLGFGADGQPVEQAHGTLNLATGATEWRTSLPLRHLDRFLPEQYARLRQRYALEGQLDVRSGRVEGDTPEMIATLREVSMRIPAEEGGIDLAGLSGELVLDGEGIAIAEPGLVGRLPQFGGASVRLRGRLDDYREEPRFRVEIACEALRLPLPPGTTGLVAEQLATVQRGLSPQGLLDLSATVWRDEGGAVQWKGVLRPQGMSLVSRHFPYRVEEIRGELAFEGERLAFEGVTARHGAAELTAGGYVVFPGGHDAGEIRIAAREVPIDEDLRAALDRDRDHAAGRPATEDSARRGSAGTSLWRELSPEGLARAEVRIFKAVGEHGDWHADVNVRLDGRATVTYRGFPYRLEKLAGQVEVVGDRATLHSVTGRHGDVSVTVDGTLEGIGGGRQTVEVRVQAPGVPLGDPDLRQAMPADVGRAFDSFHLAGRADVAGRFVHTPGRPLDFDLAATLEDASLTSDAFPYPLTGVVGVVRFVPGLATVERLAGQGGEGTLTVTGQVRTDRVPAGLDLVFDAGGVALDPALYGALPPAVRRVWDRLSPVGAADIRFRLATDGGDPKEQADYTLTLLPRGMQVTYRGFPCPLRDVRGTVHAVPGRVELRDVQGRGGERGRVHLDGEILRAADGGGEARLRLLAEELAVDDAFLASLPEALDGASRHLRPGGTLSADLGELRYAWPAPAPDEEAGGDGEPRGHWQIAGRLAGREVIVSALGERTLTGSLAGRIACDDRGDALAVDATLALDRVALEGRQVERIAGSVRKAADATRVYVDELTAEAYGGRLAGQAEIELGPPARYALRVLVEGVRLDEVIRGGQEGQPATLPGGTSAGELAGTLELAGVAGQPEARRATGQLEITRARLARLPVLVDVLNVMLLQLPDDPPFDTASIRYYLKGNTLTFEEIYLAGVTTAWLGQGTLDIGRQTIQLRFLSGPPKTVPRVIREARELLSATTRGLLEVRVTGTLRNPVTRTVPLGDLDGLLQEMFHGQ